MRRPRDYSGITGLTAFGASDTWGAFATFPELTNYTVEDPLGWVNQLATRMGLPHNNLAIPACSVTDMAPRVYQQYDFRQDGMLYLNTTYAGDILAIMGFLSGIPLNPQQSIDQVLRPVQAACTAYLATDDDSKYWGSYLAQPGVTTTGTWIPSPMYGGDIGAESQTNGSTISFQLPGPAIYISMSMQNGNSGTYSVQIDSGPEEPHTAYAPNGIYFLGGSAVLGPLPDYAPYLIRKAGLTSGMHTVTIKVTSTTGPGNKVFFDWASSSAYARYDVIVPQLQESKWNDNMFGPIPLQLVNDIVAAVYDNVNILSGDGLSIGYIKLKDDFHLFDLNNNAIWDFNGLGGDGAHPSYYGHTLIANAYYDFITGAAAPLAMGTTQSQIPTFTVGVPINFQFSASGGTPPYTWSDDWGGVIGSTSGIMSYTPDAPSPSGSYWEINVTVTDSSSPTQQSVSEPFQIVINEPSVSTGDAVIRSTMTSGSAAVVRTA